MQENFQNNKEGLPLKREDLPLFRDSSLAFCPAEKTTSNGRGAKDDQCLCFETAISTQIPAKWASENGRRNI